MRCAAGSSGSSECLSNYEISFSSRISTQNHHHSYACAIQPFSTQHANRIQFRCLSSRFRKLCLPRSFVSSAAKVCQEWNPWSFQRTSCRRRTWTHHLTSGRSWKCSSKLQRGTQFARTSQHIHFWTCLPKPPSYWEESWRRKRALCSQVQSSQDGPWPRSCLLLVDWAQSSWRRKSFEPVYFLRGTSS